MEGNRSRDSVTVGQENHVVDATRFPYVNANVAIDVPFQPLTSDDHGEKLPQQTAVRAGRILKMQVENYQTHCGASSHQVDLAYGMRSTSSSIATRRGACGRASFAVGFSLH